MSTKFCLIGFIKIRFAVDRFENEVPHFLDIKMSAQGLTINHKNTHTGQYVPYDSFTPKFGMM